MQENQAAAAELRANDNDIFLLLLLLLLLISNDRMQASCAWHIAIAISMIPSIVSTLLASLASEATIVNSFTI